MINRLGGGLLKFAVAINAILGLLWGTDMFVEPFGEALSLAFPLPQGDAGFLVSVEILFLFPVPEVRRLAFEIRSFCSLVELFGNQRAHGHLAHGDDSADFIVQAAEKVSCAEEISPIE